MESDIANQEINGEEVIEISKLWRNPSWNRSIFGTHRCLPTVSMARDPQQVLEYLRQVEEIAEKILTDKHQIVDLDRKRNCNREGLRGLVKEMKQGANKKSWVCIGSTFLKLEKGMIKEFMEKDAKVFDDEIAVLRKNLHTNVNTLQEIEGKPELKGFGLTPLSGAEMAAVSQALRVGH